MLASYAIGIGATVALMLGWAAVQTAWRKTFPGAEPDALAARGGGCAGCRCAVPCASGGSAGDNHDDHDDDDRSGQEKRR